MEKVGKMQYDDKDTHLECLERSIENIKLMTEHISFQKIEEKLRPYVVEYLKLDDHGILSLNFRVWYFMWQVQGSDSQDR